MKRKIIFCVFDGNDVEYISVDETCCQVYEPMLDADLFWVSSYFNDEPIIIIGEMNGIEIDENCQAEAFRLTDIYNGEYNPLSVLIDIF